MRQFAVLCLMFVAGLVGCRAQTKTFAALESDNIFVGNNSFARINGSYVYGTGYYLSVQSAVSAACANPEVKSNVQIAPNAAVNEVIEDLAGCINVSIVDNRSVVPNYYLWSQTDGAYELQTLGGGGGFTTPSGTGFIKITSGVMQGTASNDGSFLTNLSAANLTGTLPTNVFPTVNNSSGQCGDATHVCQITTNAAGFVTDQTSVVISAGGGTNPVNPGIQNWTGSAWSSATVTNIVSLWSDCGSNFLKGDGTCAAGGGGGTNPTANGVQSWNVSSGTWNAVSGLNITGGALSGIAVSGTNGGIFASGIIDGLTATITTTATSVNVADTSGPCSPTACFGGYFYNNVTGGTEAVTFTLPEAQAGMAYCFENAVGVTSPMTIQTSGSGQSVAYQGVNSASGGAISMGGALGDALCVKAASGTQWYAVVQSGNPTLH